MWQITYTQSLPIMCSNSPCYHMFLPVYMVTTLWAGAMCIFTMPSFHLRRQMLGFFKVHICSHLYGKNVQRLLTQHERHFRPPNKRKQWSISEVNNWIDWLANPSQGTQSSFCCPPPHFMNRRNTCVLLEKQQPAESPFTENIAVRIVQSISPLGMRDRVAS